MTPSLRLQTLTDDPSGGWALFERARAMIRAGEKVIELTIGEHDIRTDQLILDAMARSAASGHTGYASVPGVPALREAVAKRVEARTGVPTDVNNVLITPGGQSALFAAHIAAAEPGGIGAFIDPYYATYPGTIRAAGLTERVIVTEADKGFEPQKQELISETQGCASLLINSPNNPTGGIYERQTLENIAEAAQVNDFWVISDEVYDTQVWNPGFESFRSLPGMAERTIVVGSMSKSHAMTGSRIGWLVAPEAVISGLSVLATHTTYGVPGFIQDAATFALGLGADFEAKIAAPFLRRRDLVLRMLSQQNTLSAQPSGGAMYLMLDVRGTGLSGDAFAERLLDEARIAVMPGESFGKAAAGHIRLALTQADEILESAVATLIDCAARWSSVKEVNAN